MIAVRVDGDSRTNGELMERFYEGHSRCKADCSHFCSFCFWRPWRVVQSILLRLVSHGVTLDELNNLPTDKNHYLFIIVRFTTVLLRPHRHSRSPSFPCLTKLLSDWASNFHNFPWVNEPRWTHVWSLYSTGHFLHVQCGISQFTKVRLASVRSTKLQGLFFPVAALNV